MPSVLDVSKSPVSSRVSRRTSVNVKRDLDLRHTLRGGRNANQIEISKKLVVTYEFTLALEDLHFDSSLAVGGSRKDLRFFGWDGSIARDELGHDAAERLNSYKLINLVMLKKRR
jgi:NAD-specific glutamate dehydrogenase